MGINARINHLQSIATAMSLNRHVARVLCATTISYLPKCIVPSKMMRNQLRDAVACFICRGARYHSAWVGPAAKSIDWDILQLIVSP